jgi:hypothetical protein
VLDEMTERMLGVLDEDTRLTDRRRELARAAVVQVRVVWGEWCAKGH